MVSIAPNQFRISGKIVSKKKDTALANFVTITVHLNKVEKLLGPEEFLDLSTKEIAISVTDTLAANLTVGAHIQCKIRKAPGHFFVLPDSIIENKEL